MTTTDAIRLGLSWLATYALHSTVLLGAAWAWCRWAPPRALRERERLWRWTLVGGVLTASLQIGFGLRPLLGRFEWSPPFETVATSPLQGAPTEAPGLPALPIERTPSSTRPVAGAGRPEARPGAGPARVDALQPTGTSPARRPRTVREPRTTAEVSIPRPAPARSEPAAGPFASRVVASRVASSAPAGPRAEVDRPDWIAAWPLAVLSLWALAGLVRSLRLAISWLALRRLLAGRERLTSGSLFERFEALRERAGITAPVRLSISPRVSSPFSTGWLRREVCLPVGVATQLEARQQDAILAHELAHVQRGDPAWIGVFAVLEQLFFFQPLNRVARVELAELAELSCDDLAVRWTGGRLALASTLTEVAGWILDEAPRPLQIPGLVGHRSRLARRVTRLLDPSGEPAPEFRSWWAVPLAAVTLTGVALAVPGVAPRSSARAEPATPRPVADPSASATEAVRSPEASGPTALVAPSTPAAATGLAERAEDRPADTDLDHERHLLEAELELLRAELLGLTAELERLELRPVFHASIERLQQRLVELEAKHERIGALLERLRLAAAPASPTTPTSEPLPTR